MINEINEKIGYVKEQMAERNRLERLMEKVDSEISQQEQIQDKLFKELIKEEKDVDKLEKLTFTNIIHSIMGNKEELLKKEKEEHYRAKIKYDEIKNTVEHLKSERETYYAKIKKFGRLNVELDELLKEKEKLLVSSGSKISTKLDEINDEVIQIKAHIKECYEAVQAGEVACSSLRWVEESLNSAKDYGTWDMFGGGIIATSAKHSKIDEAQERMIEARAKLDRFKRELSDVNMQFHVEINIDSFSKFADYFFDGLFSDMNVQSKIKDSIRGVQEAQLRVCDVINGLKRNIESHEIKVNKLEESRKELIANA
ncbi:hypothetical protein [Oceanirhabdus sp. W0125-5]|uniref:hypothetical protein n=1 Tax=Oceanirhabdus sp. W0125-5 TaxID=2999116 RepID=UPI0022F2CE80|nr:hypothetical protein [Oceanirhabdus sp. W0125-5]WBW96920.1 hypothetical protein OW730_25000 [Oceanirhabdus sp. W0125-5]